MAFYLLLSFPDNFTWYQIGDQHIYGPKKILFDFRAFDCRLNHFGSNHPDRTNFFKIKIRCAYDSMQKPIASNQCINNFLSKR